MKVNAELKAVGYNNKKKQKIIIRYGIHTYHNFFGNAMVDIDKGLTRALGEKTSACRARANSVQRKKNCSMPSKIVRKLEDCRAFFATQDISRDDLTHSTHGLKSIAV